MSVTKKKKTNKQTKCNQTNRRKKGNQAERRTDRKKINNQAMQYDTINSLAYEDDISGKKQKCKKKLLP